MPGRDRRAGRERARSRVAQLGEFNATAGDIFWAGLAGWWLLKVIDRAVRGVPSRPSVAFGQIPAIAFFAYAVLALLWLHQLDPGPLVSLLRVIHTFLLAFLAASMIETRRDLRLVLAALVAGAVIGIVVAAFSGGDLLSARAQGELGKNPLGLVSGLLLLLALFSRWTPNLRYPLAALAVFGLVLAKSVAFVRRRGRDRGARGRPRHPGASGHRGSAGGPRRAGDGRRGDRRLHLVQVFRPEQLPGSEDFDDRSATQRIVVAAAGIEIFERNPIVGVGWRQSTAPEVIGDREIATEVRRQFPDARPTFFPDVTPASVHNTYIQILADLGLIGFTLFAALLITLGVRIVGAPAAPRPRARPLSGDVRDEPLPAGGGDLAQRDPAVRRPAGDRDPGPPGRDDRGGGADDPAALRLVHAPRARTRGGRASRARSR